MMSDLEFGDQFGATGTLPKKKESAGGQVDEVAQIIRRHGPALVQHLFSASKTVQVHEINNRAVQRALQDLMEPLRALLEEEAQISIRVSIDFLLVNGIRVATDPQHFVPATYIAEEMKKRDVEGIDFAAGITIDELAKFLSILFHEDAIGGVFEQLNDKLAAASVSHIKITQWVERERVLKDSRVEERDVRTESNQVFFRTVQLMGEVLKGIEQRKAIRVHKAERLTQQMVDIIQADESILVGLTSIKNFDEYTFAHSVNVCILSMLMADRLRLYKSDIAHLGVAALLHDIGKTYIPQTILNKPGKLADGDWELMKYHTFFGVKELSRLHTLREIVDALFVTLQHHVHYNMNGYPQKPAGWKLRLFTRIVTIADYYDAMTTPRIYKVDPVTPDRALRFILSKSGQIFDPFIAKVFIRAMGLYPIGTIVELDSGERCVVVRQNQKACYLHRPVVLRLDDPAAPPIDLSKAGRAATGFENSVAKAHHDAESERLKRTLFVAEN